MMRVADLKPGQYIELAGKGATFLMMTAHPINHGMALVVWQLDDGTWSFDCLSWMQDVGGADPDKNTNEECFARLLMMLNRRP